MEPRQLDIADAVAALAGGALSCVELSRSALDRIAEVNERARAFIFVRPEREVLEEAARLDSLSPDEAEMLPLRGIPVGLKANYQCAGAVSSAGSRILRDWIPQDDADVVRALRDAGAVVVGMTNMNEFANGPTGYNAHYGSAVNPWDPSRMPGGSSSGSAVALSLDMCLAATGSDTGGSIRTPSAFCGTVGLKPSFGLLSTRGIFPFSRTLDHAGPMAKTVNDLQRVLSAMLARNGHGAPVHRTNSRRDDLAGTTIGIDRGYFPALLESSVRARFDDAVEQIQRLGAVMRDITLVDIQDSLPTLVAILFPEAVLIHDTWLSERPFDYGEEVRESLLSGRRSSALDYLRARERRSAIRAEIDAAFGEVDILVTPTTIMQAPCWDQAAYRVDGQTIDPLNAFIRCTAPFNLSGHPVVSVPCGVTESGLPVGIQFVGQRGADFAVLDVAGCFERSRASERLVPPYAART